LFPVGELPKPEVDALPPNKALSITPKKTQQAFVLLVSAVLETFYSNTYLHKKARLSPMKVKSLVSIWA
jgi:hypothetical protein